MNEPLAVREAPASYRVVLEAQRIRPGYKQTEIGVIPADWDVKRLEKVIEKFIGGGTPSRSVQHYWGGEIPWVTVKDFATFNPYQSQETITKIGLQNSSSHLIPRGTLITSTRMALGKAVIYEVDVAINQDLKALFPKPLLVAQYLYFWFQYHGKSIDELGSGSTVKGISLPDLKKIEFLLPSRAEQEAIAEALSDADALIESLEQLITKKRHLKQGTMQQLLSGKKRLPGFGGSELKNSAIGQVPCDWRVVEIGKIASVKTGPFGSSLHERDYVNDGTPIITVEHLGERGVVHNSLPMVSNADRKRLSAYSLEEGDIVFSRVGSVDRNARISNREQGWLFSGRLLRLRRIDDNVDTQFLSYQFHFEPFKQRVRTVAVGQTMASLNTQILKGVLIVLPPPEEQAAIATILSDMDTEIAALETRLTKTRSLKQGMMHNLLTGRIRLI